MNRSNITMLWVFLSHGGFSDYHMKIYFFYVGKLPMQAFNIEEIFFLLPSSFIARWKVLYRYLEIHILAPSSLDVCWRLCNISVWSWDEYPSFLSSLGSVSCLLYRVAQETGPCEYCIYLPIRENLRLVLSKNIIKKRMLICVSCLH